MIDLIITSHSNPTLSGVAKFNAILAERLAVPCLSFDQILGRIPQRGSVLFSVKIRDNSSGEQETLTKLLQTLKGSKVEIATFFHSFDELPLEYDLLSQSTRVYSGNAEIAHALKGFSASQYVAWCPRLVDLSQTVVESSFNIFSFGMAHKLQLDYYIKLHRALERLGQDYTVWVSTAFHEKANFGDFGSISTQLLDIFGSRISFLGFLSDEAVNYFMKRVQLFVAFFPKGVRSNNTSVYVPMEKGLPLLTNLDDLSPSWLTPGINVLDIHHLKDQELSVESLRKIGRQAKRDVQKYASWEGLVDLIRDTT